MAQDKYVMITCPMHEAPRKCGIIGRLGPGIFEALHEWYASGPNKFIPAGVYTYEEMTALFVNKEG